MGLSRDCLGEAEATRTQIKAQGPPSPNHFSERVLNSGTSPPCQSPRQWEPSRPLFTCCLWVGERLEKRWALLAGDEPSLTSQAPWPAVSPGHSAGQNLGAALATKQEAEA